MAGPHKFQKGALRKAFESARAPLVRIHPAIMDVIGLMIQTIAHLTSRTPLFLAEERWKTIPWALDPNSKNRQNQLTDILGKT